LAKIFHALGHPTRLRILLTLAERPLTISNLARTFGIQPYKRKGKKWKPTRQYQALKYHVERLADVGLVERAAFGLALSPLEKAIMSLLFNSPLKEILATP